MPDRWQSFPVEFRGGLVTNLSPLQQGTQAPGSATTLRNFEPSIEGGYRRILGYSKWDDEVLSGTGLVRGVAEYATEAVAARGTHVYTSAGSGWTQLTDSVAFPPSTATADVDGAVSASTTLVVDNNSGTIKVGMVITGSGIVGTVTVASLTDQNNLVMSSAQTLSDDVSLTFTEKSPTISGSGKVRFAKHHFGSRKVLIITDGDGKPFKYDGTTFEEITTAPSDASGATHVVEHKNHLFFANDTSLIFSAPFSDTDFSAASGGGVIEFDNGITDIFTFREQLIIFTRRTIFLLAGNTIADFQVQPITKDIGAIQPDTVQEVGGDLMFLAADGFRLLSGTERNNDFGLGVVSKAIQSEVLNFIRSSTSFSTAVIREKSQYRIFGFNQNFTDSAALGIMGVQFAPQGGAQMAWGETRGINAYVAYSEYVGDEELVLFANDDGYVYRMESGNSFDGATIPASYTTPFMPITDPTTRKNFYKMKLFFDPDGSFDVTLAVKYDFNQLNVVQPDSIEISNVSPTGAYYGTALYGGGTYAENLKYIVDQQLVGSGFVASFKFESNSTDPPFALDAMVLEYGQYGRR
jgi:hypothetical protein